MNLLKNSIYIFKTDWKRIFENPATLLIIVGLMFIPSLYAWFNIGAMWDPYGNAKNLPIGIYSADTGYKIKGNHINVGDGVIDVLKDDKQLSWQFATNEEEVEKKVQDGTYYGSILIPKTFTEDLFSIISGTYKKPKIEYRVNEKINAIAPKMTEAGAEGLTEEITKGFNEVVGGVVLKISNDLGVDIEQNIPLFNKVFSVIHKLNNKANDFDDFLNILNNINLNIPEVKANLESIDPQEVINIINDIVIYVHKLNEIIPSIVKYKEEINKISGNVDNLNTLTVIVHKLNESSSNINQELNVIYNKLSSTDLNKYLNIVQSINNNDKLEHTLLELGVTVQDIKNLVQDIYLILDSSFDLLEVLLLNLVYTINNISSILSSLSLAPADIITITNNLTDLNNNLTSISTIITQLKNLLIILNTSGAYTNIINALNNVVSSIGNLQTTINYIITNINTLDFTTIINYLNEIVTEANSIVSQINNVNLVAIKREINDTLDSISNMVNNGQSIVTEVNLNNLEQLIISLTNTVYVINTYMLKIINNYDEISKHIANIDNFLINNQHKIITTITKGNIFIQNNIDNIAININKVDYYLQTNWEHIKTNILKGDQDILLEVNNVQNILNKTEIFSNGVWNDLKDFLNDIDMQVTKLSKNKQLEQIVNYLINDVKAGADFISQPVDLQTVRMYPIPNYGSSSTPFYTTLSLWVGALLLTSILSTNFYQGKTKKKLSNKEVYLGRFLTFLSITLIQSLIVVSGNLYLLKVTVVSPFLFIIFTFIISICFTSIIYTLANLFGNLGKAGAIVGLVLSISGGGGNFPIEVSGKFYQIINPILPFTHGVDLLRESLGGVYPPTVYKAILFLVVVTVLFLTIGLFGANLINPIMDKLDKKSQESHIFH